MTDQTTPHSPPPGDHALSGVLTSITRSRDKAATLLASLPGNDAITRSVLFLLWQELLELILEQHKSGSDEHTDLKDLILNAQRLMGATIALQKQSENNEESSPQPIDPDAFREFEKLLHLS